MKTKLYSLLTLIILVIATLSITAFNSPTAIDNTTYINANSILMFVSNTCAFGRDASNVFGWEYGTFYPYTTDADIANGTTKSPLFAAGLWLGGRVSGETRVTVAAYGSEYTPGPMSGETFAADAYTNSVYRVYRLHFDSAASNPNTDYLEWPDGQGAPVDQLGDPLLMGDQTLWCVYNDADTAQHSFLYGQTNPLGIEIQQTVWASDTTGQEQIIYMKYLLFNRGGNGITDFYIGIWLDPDIGWREDDFSGCDSTNDLFFNYNADNDDDSYGTAPPAFGARLVHGPVVPSPGDTATFNGVLLPDYKNLKMSSCISYVNGDDPQSSTESYNLMQGLLRNGTPLTNGTSFSFPGDPVAGTGDLDAVQTDKKTIGSVGPIDFNPGDSQYVLVKLAVGQGTDNLNSVSNLKQTLMAPDNIVTNVPFDESTGLPAGYALHENYPNPFNPATTITYELPVRAKVDIAVFNILGQRVRILVDEIKLAGPHSTSWDGTNNTGQKQPSGVYIYHARFGDFSAAQKMVLVK